MLHQESKDMSASEMLDGEIPVNQITTARLEELQIQLANTDDPAQLDKLLAYLGNKTEAEIGNHIIYNAYINFKAYIAVMKESEETAKIDQDQREEKGLNEQILQAEKRIADLKKTVAEQLRKEANTILEPLKPLRTKPEIDIANAELDNLIWIAQEDIENAQLDILELQPNQLLSSEVGHLISNFIKDQTAILERKKEQKLLKDMKASAIILVMETNQPLFKFLDQESFSCRVQNITNAINGATTYDAVESVMNFYTNNINKMTALAKQNAKEKNELQKQAAIASALILDLAALVPSVDRENVKNTRLDELKEICNSGETAIQHLHGFIVTLKAEIEKRIEDQAKLADEKVKYEEILKSRITEAKKLLDNVTKIGLMLTSTNRIDFHAVDREYAKLRKLAGEIEQEISQMDKLGQPIAAFNALDTYCKGLKNLVEEVITANLRAAHHFLNKIGEKTESKEENDLEFRHKVLNLYFQSLQDENLIDIAMKLQERRKKLQKEFVATKPETKESAEKRYQNELSLIQAGTEPVPHAGALKEEGPLSQKINQALSLKLSDVHETLRLQANTKTEEKDIPDRTKEIMRERMTEQNTGLLASITGMFSNPLPEQERVEKQSQVRAGLEVRNNADNAIYNLGIFNSSGNLLVKKTKEEEDKLQPVEQRDPLDGLDALDHQNAEAASKARSDALERELKEKSESQTQRRMSNSSN
ncbi:MAG TPA: hypothetical protein VLI69_01115 [Gammaproteobacteria bacterium]|nr:hypothetical protein [Gammaproteobacteria bacterium]